MGTRNSIRFSFIFLLLCLLLAGTASAITLNSYLTTGDTPNSSNCQTPATKTAFSPTDTTVYLWASVSNAAIGDIAEWRWYSPNGSLYYTSTPPYTFTFSGSGCTWGWIGINGQQAANLQGNWKVEFYLNGALSATANFTIGTPPRTDRGAILISFNSSSYVPGSFLDIKYQTKQVTLQGKVDLYVAVLTPAGNLVLLSGNGAPVGPLLSGLTIADGTTPLFSDYFPVDLPFGNYSFYAVLVYAGADPANNLNWASPLSQTAISYTALSPAQQSILQSLGNPDYIAVTWIAEQHEKRESWLYLSGTSATFVFLNGNLESQNPASGVTGGPGPKVDPGLFTPQTTLNQLTSSLGPPATVQTLDIAPDYQTLTYSSGLTVVLRKGRLSSAVSSAP